jgi:hypothetical protein
MTDTTDIEALVAEARKTANEWASIDSSEARLRVEQLSDLADAIERTQAVVEAAVKKERERCWIIAHDRTIACQAAVKRYEKKYPDDPYWARSERCAQSEADYIAREIRALDAPPEGEG